MMLRSSKIIIYLSVLIWAIFTKQLAMIQETFRHGARYPVFHENQDHSNTTHIVENSGQLTSEGKNMHYLLGKIVYDKYWNDLFKGTPYQNSYGQTQFYVKSTDKNRTIQSAQSHLFGLLQKLPKLQLNRTNYQYSLPAWKSFKQINNVSQVFQIFETGPAFHPTAIHVEKRGASACDEGDFLTKYDDQSCPNQKFWKSENFNTDEYSKITRDPRVKEAISALEAQVGKNVEFQDVYKWKDTHTCMKYLGYPKLKVFEDPKYGNILNFIQVYTTYLAYYAQKDQISAVSTDYFKRTLKNFDSKANQTFTPRVVIYSGHDTTIAMVFAAMRFVTVQCLIDHYLNSVNNDDTCIWQYPPFTANIIFQLWNNNGEYSIRFLYNGEVRKIPVCGWKIQCTLTEFREWVNKQLAVDDVASACGYVGSEKVFYAVIFLLASALVLLIAYIVYLHAKIKKIDSIGRAKKEGYVLNFEEKQMEEKPQQGFEVQGRTKY